MGCEGKGETAEQDMRRICRSLLLAGLFWWIMKWRDDVSFDGVWGFDGTIMEHSRHDITWIGYIQLMAGVRELADAKQKRDTSGCCKSWFINEDNLQLDEAFKYNLCNPQTFSLRVKLSA